MDMTDEIKALKAENDALYLNILEEREMRLRAEIAAAAMVAEKIPLLQQELAAVQRKVKELNGPPGNE